MSSTQQDEWIWVEQEDIDEDGTQRVIDWSIGVRHPFQEPHNITRPSKLLSNINESQADVVGTNTLRRPTTPTPPKTPPPSVCFPCCYAYEPTPPLRRNMFPYRSALLKNLFNVHGTLELR